MRRRPQRTSFPPEVLEKVFEALGVHPRDLQEIGRTAQSHQEACDRLEALKAKAKKGYRKAVHACHPDKHGDDPEKMEFFKALSEQWGALSSVEVPPPQPRPARRWGPPTSSATGGWVSHVSIHIVF